MPYSEKLLNVSDLLSAWQNRAMREGSQAEQAEISKQRSLQNELLQQEIQKNKDIRDLALGQGGIPYTSAMSNSASIGYPEYRIEQEGQKKLSQLTGRPMPTQGIVGGGYGGHGGWGGGGGTPEPQRDPYSNYTGNQLAEMNAINEWQPQQQKGNVSTTPMPGTIPVGNSAPQTIPDMLADSVANQKGLESLYGQAGSTLPAETQKNIDDERRGILKPVSDLMKEQADSRALYEAGITSGMDKSIPVKDQIASKEKRDTDSFNQAQNRVTRAVQSDKRFDDLLTKDQNALLAAIPAEMEAARKRGDSDINYTDLFNKYNSRNKAR